MSKAAYKIQRLKKLMEAKKAAQDLRWQVTKTSPSKPTPISRNPEKRPVDPAERPKSLEGVDFPTIRLLALDGELTEKEKKWFNSKNITRTLLLSPQVWMSF